VVWVVGVLRELGLAIVEFGLFGLVLADFLVRLVILRICSLVHLAVVRGVHSSAVLVEEQGGSTYPTSSSSSPPP